MGIYIDDYLKAADLVAYHHKREERIVLARGTFDVFNLGHIDFLERASDLGDILMVNVNNDLWVKSRKSSKKSPLRSEDNRAKLVAKQEMVNYVFVHPGYRIHPGIELAILARPDILVREDKDPEFQELEKKILMKRLGYLPDYRPLPRSGVDESSSEILERMKEMLRPEVSEEVLEGLIREMRTK